MAISKARAYWTPRYSQVVKDLEAIVGKTKYYDYSPVLMRQIDQNTGVEVWGVFKTNDDTTTGKLSYITVLRQGGYPIPHDGFGLAWKKTILHPGDSSAMYNVYLVDNDVLHEEVYALNEMIVQDAGINNFLIAGKREILAGTWYKFKIRVQANYSTRIWIMEDTYTWDQAVNLPYNGGDNPTGYCLDRGAQVAGATTAAYVPISQGTYFGIGVPETQNSEWWYRDIVIASIADAYPMQLFKLEAPGQYFNSGSPAHVYYNGYGQWNAETPFGNGVSLYIWNVTNSEWELAGTNTATAEAEPQDKVIDYTLPDIDDYITTTLGVDHFTLLAYATEADETAILRTHYIGIDNVFPSGIHMGNMLDIYVHAPDRFSTAENDAGAVSSVMLTADEGFNLPIQEILEVRGPGGTLLTRNVDYSISLGDTGNAWSTKSNQSINIVGGPLSITVLYRYYIDGATLQDFVEDNSVRNAGTDNLVKIVPPATIEIESLEYRDGPAQEDVRTSVAAWINDLGNDTTFEITDLINYLYSLGITYVDLDSLIINVRKYDYTGALVDSSEITSDYTITTMNAFVTDTSQLYGIIRL